MALPFPRPAILPLLPYGASGETAHASEGPTMAFAWAVREREDSPRLCGTTFRDGCNLGRSDSATDERHASDYVGA